MTFELKVKIVGNRDQVLLKKEEELDFIPEPFWAFQYGNLELKVEYLVYNPLREKKIVKFEPILCEDWEEFENALKTLKGYGWKETLI